jgi:hypothetical protein
VAAPWAPTIAIVIVTTPRFPRLETVEPEPVLAVVAVGFAADELLPVHPATTTENAATAPMSANC